MNESVIFNAAVKLPNDQRPAFLDAACAGNSQLRSEVDGLLHKHDGAGSFMDRPASQLPATGIFRPITEGPGTIIGPYKLREQLGEGGFGVVYVAEQDKPVRRKVALKIIKPGMDTKDVIARFEAERQALALMDHPNVAKVLDAGATDSGRPYFVMELVHGLPITEFCDKNKLPTRERLGLFAEICRAVQHAHQKGIIHRDLKPSNIMVTLHDGQPVPKVIDFGVSKALSQQLTEKSIYTAYGQMIGTPSYMSPEQAEMSGLGIDTRSDVYSLGVLLYELLTGKTPLDAKRLRDGGYGEMLRIIREEEPARPSLKISTLGDEATAIAQHRHTDPAQLRRALKGELDWIVMKCLEKDRSRRYETAVGLARDVDRYLKDEPVEACPPSALYRLQKFTRRNRVTVFLTLFVAASLLAILFNAIIGQFSIRRERDRAVAAGHQAIAERDRAEQARQAETQQRLLAEQRESEAKTARVAEAEQRQAAEASERAALEERNKAIAAREELRVTNYAVEMNQVQAAVESLNFPRAAQLLALQRPPVGETDLRGFEWHYWQRKLKSGWVRSQEVPQLRSAVVPLSVSPTALLSRDGRRLAVLMKPTEEQTSQAAFGLLTVLDGVTGRELVAPFSLFPNEQVYGSRMLLLNMSADGSRLAATITRRPGSVDPTPQEPITIRDVNTGSEIRQIESPGIITDLALAADGNQLAIEYLEQGLARRLTRVKIWNTSSGELVQTLPELPWTNPHNCILWSPDGKRLLRQSVAYDRDTQTYRELFQVVDVASAEQIWQRDFSTHLRALRRAFAWSPDGKLVLVFERSEPGISEKNNAQLWNAETGMALAILDRDSGSPGRSNMAQFSPDGQLLAIGANSNEIYIWEVPKLPPDGASPLRAAAPNLTLRASDGIQALAFSPDGRELYSLDRTSLVTYDPTTREDPSLGPDTQRGLMSVTISPDTSKVAFGTGSIWDLKRNQEACRLDIGEYSSLFYPFNFSPDGRRLVFSRKSVPGTEGVDQHIFVHDTQTGQLLVEIGVERPIERVEVFLTSPVFRPDGSQIAALMRWTVNGVEKTRLLTWDAATGQPLLNTGVDASMSGGVRYSRDGRSLIVGTRIRRDVAALYYDADTLKLQRSVPLPETTGLYLIDGHNEFFGSGGRSEFVLWDLAAGREWLRTPGYSDVTTYAVSPDRSRVVLGVGSENGSELTLWSPKSGRQLLTLKCPSYCRALAFSPDGHRLIGGFTATSNLTVKHIQIWDATPVAVDP